MRKLSAIVFALAMCAVLTACVLDVRGRHVRSFAVGWPRWNIKRSVIVELYHAQGHYSLDVMWIRAGEGPVRSDEFSWEKGWRTVEW